MTRWATWLRQRRADYGPRVVAIGGGTGLSTLVRGLKRYTSNITALVTVTDDGGSSGRLVDELGILPPGDIRNVLVALAEIEPLMEQLLQHRFTRGSLKGHPFGNLLLGALTEILGDFERAVQESSKVLAVRGRVLPSSLEPVVLCAEFADGRHICGETKIVSTNGRIKRAYLEPQNVKPPAAALAALQEADMIVIGPGSLYTSLLPNLLIPALAEGVRQSRALKVFVVNVMTQPGETDGATASDHLRVILEHSGREIVRFVLVNTGQPTPEQLNACREAGVDIVQNDLAAIRRLGFVPVTADVIHRSDPVRHDPNRLAVALLRLFLRFAPGRPHRLWRRLWLGLFRHQEDQYLFRP